MQRGAKQVQLKAGKPKKKLLKQISEAELG